MLLVMVTFASLLGLRLAYWQVGEATDLRRLAEVQLSRPTTDDVRRGDIIDRRGTLLATSAYHDLLAAHPDLIPSDQRAAMARRLAELLGFDTEREQELVERFESGVPYVIVERKLTDEKSQQVRQQLASGELVALSLEPKTVRFYPNPGGSPRTTLASQLLGFVTDDGQGQYGIEQRHHELLAGTPTMTAATGSGLLASPAGGSLQLTIDASLQLRLEKELHAAWVANRAQRVSAVVLDPHTGAVLAWGSVPGYDANAYATTARRNPELFIDPIAGQVYEPGSVMKMLTAAAALEKGVVTRQSTIIDDRTLRFGESVVIRNFDRRGMGPLAFEDVIARSRNVATGRVAMRLGDTTAEASAVLYDMWQRMGIGQRTGIGVAGEAAGLVSDPASRRWERVDLVNRAFGQGLAVTPLQLAVAFSAMVNGGELLEPHVVARSAADPSLSEPVRVIDDGLSRELRELMIHVVSSVPHYAEATLIPGYVVGGKTGTAQIWDSQKQRWKDPLYNHTFAGFVGGEKPEAVIVVRVHETEPRVKRRFGHVLEMTSNEVFRRIAQDVIEILDVPPVEPLEPGDVVDEPADEPGDEADEPADEADDPADEADEPADETDAAASPRQEPPAIGTGGRPDARP